MSISPSHADNAPADPPPRIAYFTNIYPTVSHTFIRREILALEERGYNIRRIAVRSGPIVDESDAAEKGRTHRILEQPLRRLLMDGLLLLLFRFSRATNSFCVMLRMAARSDRGILRHFAYWFEAAHLVRLLERERIEHVHVHFGTNAAAVARLMRRMGGPPYSMTVHGPEEFDAANGLSLGQKMRDAAFVVAISDYCAAQLRRWLSFIHWGKIHIVGCPVDRKWTEAASPVPDAAADLVCVGRLAPQKGHITLIDAFAKALARGVAGTLVIIGHGELAEAVESRIGRHNIAAHVRMLGWCDEAAVRRELLAARALVLASYAEGLPVVIMEAMALQRPVVTTWITAVPELVRQGMDGWLVAPGNVDALADAIRTAMTVPVEQLREMGRNAQAQVLASHDAAAEAAKLDALFRAHTRPEA